MVEYLYKATTISGQTVEGLIEGKDEDSVIHNLHHLGYIPIRVIPLKEKREKAGISFLIPQRVRLKDVLLFTQELSSLVSSGLSIDRSLSLLGSLTENRRLRGVIKDILKRVEGGDSLSEAMSHHQGIFSKLYINMIKAGESGGFLEIVLSRMAQYLQSIKEIREYLISVMIYPLILTIVSGISIIILLTFVIPRFARIFSDMGRAIPIPTQILLFVSHWIREYWWICIGIIGVIYLVLKIYKQDDERSLKWGRFKLNLWTYGEMIRKIEVARFSRTLGTLLKSGVSILSALNLVKDISQNRAISDAISYTHDRLREGSRLSKSLDETGVFPPMAIQMIGVGEETGRLDEMLIKVAETYEESTKNTVRRIVSLLEPFIILVMGCVVGFIVISMLLAIFSINEIPF